jgi:hypothetical protein
MMNERIKELMKQAGTDSSGKWMGIDHAEKFAELIAQQCANIIESQDVDPAFKLRMSWAIKKHFGVAE